MKKECFPFFYGYNKFKGGFLILTFWYKLSLNGTWNRGGKSRKDLYEQTTISRR